jgi:hypothetical protein
MFWLWLVLIGCIMITSHISMARSYKRPSRTLCEAIVANLIFGACWRGAPCKQETIRRQRP